MTPDCTFAIRTPAELVAIVPFLMGYHPNDSVAMIGLADGRVEFAVCHDLPPPDWAGADAEQAAGRVADTIARQKPDGVIVIGYGPESRVAPAVSYSAQAVRDRRITVLDIIRVTDGRWISYFCSTAECCPPEGTPCLPGDSVIATEATFRGQVALPSRKELTAQVAPIDGAGRIEMVRATERARRRFADLLADGRTADGRTADRYGRLIRENGRVAVREAEERYRSGGTLGPDEVAWLGVLLVDRSVEDHALDRAAGAQEWQIRLWTDVLRRVEPAYVAPPACLLGFTAWRAGRGALARVAVDRALAVEPRHQLAEMMHNVLGFGLSPNLMRLPR